MINQLTALLSQGPECLSDVSRTAIKYVDSELTLLRSGAESDLKYVRCFLIKLVLFIVLASFSLTLLSVSLVLLIMHLAIDISSVLILLGLGILVTVVAAMCLIFAMRDGGRIGAVMRNFGGKQQYDKSN